MEASDPASIAFAEMEHWDGFDGGDLEPTLETSDVSNEYLQAEAVPMETVAMASEMDLFQENLQHMEGVVLTCPICKSTSEDW